MAMTSASSLRTTALMVVLSVSVTGLLAQTQIKRPNNRYTPQQDVELGREAAAEVRQQYPVIQDERITRYFTRLGDLLGHGDRWWQGGNDAEAFLERVDWIALQMAVKAEAYLLRHMKR